MKKLLFIMVVAFGLVSMRNHVSLTPDNQVHVMNWSFPVPATVQNSPLYTIATTVITGQMGALPMTASGMNASYRTASQAVRPILPGVTTTAGSFNANAPAIGSAGGGDAFGAASRALRGTQ